MAVSTLVVTPGLATANAYCTVAFADQYDEDRPSVGTTWSAATADAKAAAILWATTLMDSLWDWTGFSTDEVQVLMWPRQGMQKRTLYEFVDENTIPPELQEATAEYARQLLVADLAGNSQVETEGIKSLKAGSVAFTFRENVVAKRMPDTVFHLIPSSWGTVRSRVQSFSQLVRV